MSIMWNKKTASSRNTSEPTNSDNDKHPSMAAFNALEIALWSVYNTSFYFIFEKEMYIRHIHGPRMHDCIQNKGTL